eukprot:g620.t1
MKRTLHHLGVANVTVTVAAVGPLDSPRTASLLAVFELLMAVGTRRRAPRSPRLDFAEEQQLDLLSGPLFLLEVPSAGPEGLRDDGDGGPRRKQVADSETSGTSKATFEAELRATLTKVPASERQKTLATALESLGRQVEPELLSAMRSVTGALLRDVEKAQTQKGELLPNGIAVLAVQFALAGENLEAALARLPGIAGEARTTNGSTKSNWELLDKVMTEFLPLIDDPHAIHVCFHRILDTLVKSDSTHAWEVLKRMEAAKEDYLKKVMAVIDNRAVKEMDEVLLGSLYEACIRCGQVKKLLNYVQKLREESGLGVVPSRITLGCMVEALASNNDADGAYEVIQEALADPQTANLVNAVTYSSVLKSFNHQKRFHRDVYDEMIRQKVEFSVTTYNALLDVCARSGEIARAEPLLKDMAQQGISPNIITYGTLANRSKKPKMAFEMVEDLRNEFGIKLNMHVYNNLIHAATCDNDMAKAQETFATMLGHRVRPDGSHGEDPVALLRTAIGLQTDSLQTESLHPALCKVLMTSISWASAPLRGNSALQEEVIHDVLDFLSRNQSALRSDFCSLPQLTAEVRQPKLSSSNSPKKAETMAQPPPPRPSGYFEKKGEVHELRQLLRGASAERDQQKKRDAIKKVIAYMTLGIDVSPLFSEMVMASATTDLVQKKMVYLYLVNYAESNSDLAILAINTLQKDCRDDDPMIRGLALRSLCSLSLANMVEYLQPAVQRALEDTGWKHVGFHQTDANLGIRRGIRIQDVNGYVRKTAVIGVVKIFYINPSVVTETELLPSLKRLVNDNDAHVVSNTISALEEVLASEGGYMPSEEVITALLNRIMHFSEWGQCAILRLLTKYSVANEGEMFDIMNILDDLLKQSSSAVVLSVTKQDVLQRLKGPLLTLMAAASTELAYTVLVHIHALLGRGPRTHNKADDAWIIVDGDVYDVTKFAGVHPGGTQILLEYAGKDATEDFYALHRLEVLDKYQRLKKGRLADAKGPPPKKAAEVMQEFSKVPFAEPTYLQGFKSPYFNETHIKLRQEMHL